MKKDQPAPASGAQKPETAHLFNEHAFDQFVEYLMQFPDPDQVLQKAGMSRADLRRLEGDDEISGALETREAAVSGTPWRLEPGAGADYDFIHAMIEPRIERIISGAWKAVPYGFSVQEVTYRQDGRQIVWASIREKPFEWFAPRPWSGKKDDLDAIAQIVESGLPAPDCALNYYPAAGFVGAQGENVHLVRPGKFFVTRRKATDDRNPYGEALLSRAYWPWYFRTAGWKFWARFLERFGAPLLVGKTANSTRDMADALATALQSAVAAVGKDDDVTAISPTNAGDSFDRFSQSVDKRIQKLILGQTLTTDVGKNGGALATAKVQNEVRDDRRIADVRMVTPTIQAMIDTLLVLNGRPMGAVRFVMEDEVGLQPDRAERDATLANAGIVKFTPAYVKKAYDLDEADFIVPEALPVPAGDRRPVAKLGAMFSARKHEFTPQQQAIEDAADALLDEVPEPIPPDTIRAAIMSATDPDDLTARLSLLLDRQDPRFADLIAKSTFAANVLGYVVAEREAG